MFAEQAFWLSISDLISEQLVVPLTPVKIEVPSELPKVSLVNKSFQELKNHLAKFDKMVKERTTHSAITEGTWGFEHTREVFITQVIPFLNSLRESFKVFDNGLHDELNEVKTVFNQMEAAVEQYIVHIPVNSLEVIDEYESMRKRRCEEYNRNLTLEAELSKMNELLKTLKNNKEAHEDYLTQTKEHTDTLHGIVEQARKQNPRDPYLDYAFERKKLVAFTPMNKTRKIRSQEPKESLRVIPSTSASGSQSKNNIRKNRIMPTTCRNKKNKTVEVYPRKVMSSSNKRNHVSMCNANFKHAVKDANSKFVCSTCNGCLFYANHDKYVVTYINDVNKRVKSKSAKRKKIEWKPTGKVFTSVGHRWLPTGRTFTINGTKCPMTRITSNPIVPPKETSQTPVITPNPEVKNPCPLTPYVLPSKNDWDLLFQPMFDECFNPPPSIVSPVCVATPLKPADPTGYRQEEGIDFEESFTPVARIEAIRIFIANAANKNMTIYQNGCQDGFLKCPRGIFINQTKYSLETLKKYGMDTSNLVDTPMVDRTKLDKDLHGKLVNARHYRGLIGSLMYLTSSRPDPVFVVCMYADHVGCQDTRKSTSGSAQFLGDRLIMDLNSTNSLCNCDNKRAISLCCNNVQHSRSKHIDVRYHFIKEQVEIGLVELYFVRTEYQLADIFTKAFPREIFEFLINKIRMKSMSLETLKSLAEKNEE
ncbi:retrovirus-related pol polyprotein from transposon TNT 1-94 [Tanacetum coccineum]|uniref:Retrovirus-related pol polyprotein from transposon TNT 1-94 n=1 Tax=Tanacetum coccineum TaxID=301880 RepID=A0ABQ5DTQ0_9ASTR